MSNYNYEVSIIDTDSCTFGKQDKIPFSKEEIDNLHNELNSLYGEYIKWDFEAEYSKVIAIRTKNYVLLEPNGKLTIKGSALKASTKSPRMKQLIKDVINNILEDKTDYLSIYHTYVKEINKIEDINPWCVRKTITNAVLNSNRKNETNVLDAIQGTEIVEGDRCHMFYRQDGTLCLAEKFNGDYSKDKLFQQAFDTVHTFSTILDMSQIKNYKLKKMKKELETL